MTESYRAGKSKVRSASEKREASRPSGSSDVWRTLLSQRRGKVFLE